MLLQLRSLPSEKKGIIEVLGQPMASLGGWQPLPQLKCLSQVRNAAAETNPYRIEARRQARGQPSMHSCLWQPLNGSHSIHCSSCSHIYSLSSTFSGSICKPSACTSNSRHRSRQAKRQLLHWSRWTKTPTQFISPARATLLWGTEYVALIQLIGNVLWVPACSEVGTGVRLHSLGPLIRNDASIVGKEGNSHVAVGTEKLMEVSGLSIIGALRRFHAKEELTPGLLDILAWISLRIYSSPHCTSLPDWGETNLLSDIYCWKKDVQLSHNGFLHHTNCWCGFAR